MHLRWCHVTKLVVMRWRLPHPIQHKPNHAADRNRNKDNNDDTPGLESSVGGSQTHESGSDEQNCSGEEQEKAHEWTTSEKLKS